METRKKIFVVGEQNCDMDDIHKESEKIGKMIWTEILDKPDMFKGFKGSIELRKVT